MSVWKIPLKYCRGTSTYSRIAHTEYEVEAKFRSVEHSASSEEALKFPRSPLLAQCVLAEKRETGQSLDSV